MSMLKKAGVVLCVAGFWGAAIGLVPAIANMQAGSYRVEEKVQQLKQRLSLTEDQTVKVRAILQAAHAPAGQAKAGASDADRQAMFQAAKERREKMNQEIKAVLTAQQQTEYDKYQEERRAQWQKKMRESHGAEGAAAEKK